jgi:hypothetical protein
VSVGSGSSIERGPVLTLRVRDGRDEGEARLGRDGRQWFLDAVAGLAVATAVVWRDQRMRAAAGYGPVCAEKWGLLWGERDDKPKALASGNTERTFWRRAPEEQPAAVGVCEITDGQRGKLVVAHAGIVLRTALRARREELRRVAQDAAVTAGLKRYVYLGGQ